jgi:membrane-associated protein
MAKKPLPKLVILGHDYSILALMSPDAITHLILEYRYWILIPLTFIEGPIVAFVAGTLASLGYFNIYALAVLFLVRDFLVDAFMYFLGRYGGKTRFAHWFYKKVGITEDHLKGVHGLWERNTGKTMFFSKLSYGLAATFLIVAGIVEVNIKKFFFYAILTTLLQYGVLLFLGYFFGGAFGTVSKILNNIGYVIGGVTIIITIYYLFTHFMRRRLLKQEEAEEKKNSNEAQGQ